LVNKDLYID